ncbi:DUF2207 domain-containing protein [Radiobacillus sp. PE A8.2]|uniref:DUF2207 domain-containing protein n=1 Tax=Radiobacillus sp. PE A8.2 TaxID=3380349 RepID=UPI00388E86F4
MKKIIPLLSFISALFILTGFSDGDRSFSIDKVDIQAQIDTDGTIHVQELFQYTFDGSFQGMTRAIKSNAQNFHAYLVDEQADDASIATDGLEQLEIELDEEQYKIYTSSENETKQVLYSYDIVGSVTKYTDVADLTYTFFDSSNETDLHDVSIHLYTPAEAVTENTFFFLHAKEKPAVESYDGGIHYSYDFVSADQSYDFRLIFPADQLTAQPVDENKEMKSSILTEEQLLQEKYKNLDKNLNMMAPVLLIFIFLSVIIGVIMLWNHPNRYKGTKNKEALIQLMEKNDPLFVKYVANNTRLSGEDFIAGLFSLHQRGLVSIGELPSDTITSSRTPFRFTWIGTTKKLSESDQFLKEWLFTKEDEQGEYFSLESLEAPENYEELLPDQQKIVRDKMEALKIQFEHWRKLVKEQPSFQKLKSSYRPFLAFSFVDIVLTGLFVIYFYYQDVLPVASQYVVSAILTIVAVSTVAFKSNKILLAIYYLTVTIMCLFLTFTTGTWALLAFILVAGTLSLVLPSYQWNDDVKELRYAIKTAKRLFSTNQYPTGTTPEEAETKMQYAILLGYGNMFAKQLGSFADSYASLGHFPLLKNPVSAASAFDPSIYLIASSSAVMMGADSQGGGTSGGGAAGGGGGAGAF